MKPKKPSGPLRGEAAWLAAKKDIAARNEAARERIAGERAGVKASKERERRDQARAELSNLPTQPG